MRPVHATRRRIAGNLRRLDATKISQQFRRHSGTGNTILASPALQAIVSGRYRRPQGACQRLHGQAALTRRILGYSRPVNSVRQPPRRAFMLRPWFPLLLGVGAVPVVWALVDNVRDRNLILTACLGVISLGLVIQLIVSLLIRRAQSK